VQPGITALWNKLTAGLGETDFHMEAGVQTALSNVISDQVNVPDFYDYDMDGFFCDTAAGCNPIVEDSIPDLVGRYAFYNTLRLKGIQPTGNAGINIIQEFIDALRDLVWQENAAGDFGFMDPALNCGGGLGPAECDPCCVTQPACCASDSCTNMGECVLPTCCADDSCGDTDTCAARSPYGNTGDPNPIYPWVFEDGHYEIRRNNASGPPWVRNSPGISFREDIGRDDEHHLYRKQSANPNGEQTYDGLATGFFLNDTTSFYGFPDPDILPGIFPFFYKLADWGTELTTLTYTGVECHWCNANTLSGGTPCATPLPTGLTQMSLCDACDPSLQYAGGQCVDNANRVGWVAGQPPQVLDNVYVPGATDPLGLRFFADPAACAVGPNAASLWEGWKRGADRFCTTNYPHHAKCTKSGWDAAGTTSACTWDNPETATVESIYVSCDCGEAGSAAPSAWQDDFLDHIIYNLIPQTYDWARTIVFQSAEDLAGSIEVWYDEAADFIEPACPGCPVDGCPGVMPPCCACDNSYTKMERAEGGGVLFIIREIINSIYALTDDWILPVVNPTYLSGSCTDVTSPDVWCVPPATTAPTPLNLNGQQECCGVTASEAATFDYNANGIRGDLADVVRCLWWQSNDTVTYPSGTVLTATGNYEKFNACMTNCDVDHCSNLPRSVIPGFCSTPFVASNAAAVAAYDQCLTITNPSNPVAECATECAVPTAIPPSASLEPWEAPNLTQIDTLLDPADMTSIYNQCRRNRSLIFNGQCDPAWTPASINCGAATAFRNDVEAQICIEQGTCCDFPGPAPGINAFYDSIISALSDGMCGAIWDTRSTHYFEVYSALGSCYANSSSNVFQNAVLNARNNIAVAGVDDSDIAAFDTCLSAITDGVAGCTPGTCNNLPSVRISNPSISYNIPPYAAGLAEPVGVGSLCDDTATGTGTIPGLENCLNSCSQANCWTPANGGLLPTSSCNGNTFTYTSGNPSFALVVPGRSAQDDADYTAMQNCLNNCEVNQSDCQAVAGLTLNWLNQPYNIAGPYVTPDMTDVNFLRSTCLTASPCTTGDSCDNWNGGILDCTSATYVRSQIENCAATHENSCSDFWGVGIDPSDITPAPTFYESVLTARENAAGSCATSSPFWTMLEQSRDYARIQVTKAQKRYQHLNSLMAEATWIRDLMLRGVNEITAFLDNWTIPPAAGWVDTPAERLIDAMDNNTIREINKLSSTVVYMWRDADLETPRQDGTRAGLWHAAKVEARIPRRCNNACGIGGGSDPDWPTVRTRTSGFLGRKRCYYLVNETGMVKARVIRWDQDRPGANESIKLPSGEPIWNIRFTHPSTSGVAGDPNLVFNECTSLIHPRLVGTPYSQAVMLYDNLDLDGNGIPDFLENPSTAYWRCWTYIHDQLLAYGTSAESCARYFFAGGSGLSPEGFSLSFIPCDSGFLNGSN
jgi:hypothetical protein